MVDTEKHYAMIATIGAFLLGCTSTFIVMRPAGSYERCMLNEMQGRDWKQSWLAEDYCEARYPHAEAQHHSQPSAEAPRVTYQSGLKPVAPVTDTPKTLDEAMKELRPAPPPTNFDELMRELRPAPNGR